VCVFSDMATLLAQAKVCCSMLQHVAACCSMLQRIDLSLLAQAKVCQLSTGGGSPTLLV